jgi:hypothetical protein
MIVVECPGQREAMTQALSARGADRLQHRLSTIGNTAIGIEHAAAQRPPNRRLDEAACREQFVQVNAGLNPAALREIDQVFSRKIAGRAWRVWAAAQSATGGVEACDTQLHGAIRTCQRRAARVVQVQRASPRRD